MIDLFKHIKINITLGSRKPRLAPVVICLDFSNYITCVKNPWLRLCPPSQSPCPSVIVDCCLPILFPSLYTLLRPDLLPWKWNCCYFILKQNTKLGISFSNKDPFKYKSYKVEKSIMVSTRSRPYNLKIALNVCCWIRNNNRRILI